MKPISCHHCHFNDDGSCLWFKEYKNEKESRLIPDKIIDKGCKFYITNKLSYLIEIFEGRIMYE